MNSKPFVFWKFHAVVSVILFLIINSLFWMAYSAFPQAITSMVAMNQSLNIIAWVYMIYALKIYSSEEMTESIAKAINKCLFEDD